MALDYEDALGRAVRAPTAAPRVTLRRAIRYHSDVVLAVVLTLMAVSATPDWAVMRFTAPNDLREDADTFRTLLAGELRERGVEVMPGGRDLGPCSALACGLEGARALRAGSAVIGSLDRFGTKLVVSSRRVRSPDGQSLGDAQLIIDRLEDLDVAAKRLASALIEGRSPDDTAELGAITSMETEPLRRKVGTGGLSLSLGAVLPLQDTYGRTNGGLGVDLGYWYEAKHFAIEPTLGVRFSTDTSRGRSFFEIPLDLGAYWIMSTGDFAPFVGGGAGLRYLNETRPSTIPLGNVIRTEHEGEASDDRFGAGVFARAGVLLLRTYSVRISASVRYGVTFVELNDADFAQALSGHVTIHF